MDDAQTEIYHQQHTNRKTNLHIHYHQITTKYELSKKTKKC